MTATSNGFTGSGWTVESQTETNNLGPGGTFVPGMQVTFITGKGVRGSVFLPREQFSVENVKAMIATHAAQLDAVADLKHDS